MMANLIDPKFEGFDVPVFEDFTTVDDDADKWFGKIKPL